MKNNKLRSLTIAIAREELYNKTIRLEAYKITWIPSETFAEG